MEGWRSLPSMPGPVYHGAAQGVHTSLISSVVVTVTKNIQDVHSLNIPYPYIKDKLDNV